MAINNVIITGNLGRDPEIKSTNNGNRYATLSVAVSERFKDKNGQKQERVDWIKVQTWTEGIVNFCESYLEKGDSVVIQGKLKTNSWKDQQGNNRYETIVSVEYGGKIEFNGKKPDNSNGQNQQGYRQAKEGSQQPAVPVNNNMPTMDDDIPF